MHAHCCYSPGMARVRAPKKVLRDHTVAVKQYDVLMRDFLSRVSSQSF